MRHKAVLVMRCYDGMTHSEIAESLGCSEFSTRMLFLRAKRALQRELSRNGFAKGSLLTALVLFGKITAPSKAAAAQVSVTTAAMKVGLLAEVAVLATSKTGIVSLTAAGALTAGTIVAPSILPGDNIPPLGNAVVAELGLDNNARKQDLFYFPDGLTRAMALRTRFAASGDESEREILQHGSANYDYQDNTVNINNHRMWDANLRVPTLPTDELETIEFIQKVAPGTISFGNVSVRDRDRYEGLLVGVPRDGAGGSDQPWAVPHQNALQEDYFKADFPTTTVQVDNRDAMHKRGWTYFRISGQVNGQEVSGSGRIPFFYDAFKDGGAWLKLQVGALKIVDTYREAHVSRAQSDAHDTYRPGSFFKGLGRPWMGLHTVDTVRRDAAEERIWFNAEYLPGGQFAQVELDCEGARLVYKIDMKTDVVDEITFLTDQGVIGNLKFSYLQSIDGVGREFSRPTRPQKRMATKDNPGLMWLVQMGEGTI
ncbi:MAG: RNA polymerase sigma factor [Planctomycetota bacterium]